jgi:hypothetical protein
LKVLELISTHRLFTEKQEHDAITDIEHFISQHTDIQLLIAVAADGLQYPDKGLGHVKPGHTGRY